MISEQTEHTEPGPQSSVSKRQAVAAIADRIRRYNSDIDPRSDTFRAAVVLLAAADLGQNIDLLARCTSFDRSFVARCARRLIDNGVWLGGATVSDWSAADEASGTFWNDVAVAEGKMCRRVVNGSVEWAPAGFWNKSFHFNDPGAAHRTTNKYLDPLPEPTAPAAPETEIIGEAGSGESAAETERIGEVQHRDTAETGADDELDLEPQEDPPQSADGDDNLPPSAGNPVCPLEHVFPDVIWIG